MTIFYLLTRRMTRSRRENESPARVPYGIAIALGAFALLLIDRGSGSVERSLPPVHLSDDDVRDSAALSMLVHAGDASRDAGHLDAVQRS